jgi:hypothetical protein
MYDFALYVPVLLSFLMMAVMAKTGSILCMVITKVCAPDNYNTESYK